MRFYFQARTGAILTDGLILVTDVSRPSDFDGVLRRAQIGVGIGDRITRGVSSIDATDADSVHTFLTELRHEFIQIVDAEWIADCELRLAQVEIAKAMSADLPLPHAGEALVASPFESPDAMGTSAPTEAEAATEEENPPCPHCNGDPDDCTQYECPGYGRLSRHSTCSTEDEAACSHCDRCQNHCECQTCGTGTSAHRVESICSNCEHCERHCECAYCESCSENVDHTCDRSYCDSCCSNHHEHNGGETPSPDQPVRPGNASGRRRSIADISKNVKFKYAKKEEFKTNPVRRMISAEIEIARCDDWSEVKSVVNGWDGVVVEDGSLPSTGMEINTCPAEGDVFIRQIRDITRSLGRNDAHVDKSCGLHVHVDARDMRIWDLRRLAMLWRAVESPMFKIVAPSREMNHYSQPVRDAYADLIKDPRKPIARLFEEAKAEKAKKRFDPKLRFARGLYGSEATADLRKLEKDKYTQSRYYALNLHSWVYRRTVECRMHHGTADFAKITNWGMLFAAIVDYAARKSDREVRELLDKHYGQDLLHVLAPTLEVKNWILARHKRFGSK